MSVKYHIDINGEAVPCPAKIQCTKTDSEGNPAPHFTGNKQEAQAWAEKENAREMGGSFGGSATQVKNVDKGGNDLNDNTAGYNGYDNFESYQVSAEVLDNNETAYNRSLEIANDSSATGADLRNEVESLKRTDSQINESLKDVDLNKVNWDNKLSDIREEHDIKPKTYSEAMNTAREMIKHTPDDAAINTKVVDNEKGYSFSSTYVSDMGDTEAGYFMDVNEKDNSKSSWNYSIDGEVLKSGGMSSKEDIKTANMYHESFVNEAADKEAFNDSYNKLREEYGANNVGTEYVGSDAHTDVDAIFITKSDGSRVLIEQERTNPITADVFNELDMYEAEHGHTDYQSSYHVRTVDSDGNYGSIEGAEQHESIDDAIKEAKTKLN